MDETILLPSPNWFLVMGMAVSKDGWIIYGGPSKCICILEPLPPDNNNIIDREHNGYRAHVFGKVHGERVTTVDICPAWPEKKCFLTGAGDGTVKQWFMEKKDRTVHIKSTHNHTVHSSDQEEVVAVGYCTNTFAVTVGVFGRIVKWDLQSNVIKSYDMLISKFKPTCIACSAHVPFQVAVGTKQGVVLVVDLNDTGKTIYKVRCHDDEVLSVSWCPQYSVPMKTLVKKTQKKSANDRMDKIRQENNEQLNDIVVPETLDVSATTKSLPEDSFDETIVEEDLFDVYKDPEDDEFGHKKYTPEVIVVKEQDAVSTNFDYLTECQKLKEKILKSKEPEPSINSLVDALDNAHLDNVDSNSVSDLPKNQENTNENTDKFIGQTHHHLLASIGKHGNLRIWSKVGKLLGTALLQNKVYHNRFPNQKINQPAWATLLWYKPDILLITDARGQLLQCNPLKIDSRNKVHDLRLVDAVHKRGTYCMITNAPRVQHGYGDEEDVQVENENVSQDNSLQTADKQCDSSCSLPDDEWFVWTAAQDRTIVCYSMTNNKKISTYYTCGALVYNIQTCPYDAKRTALCVGDGAVRVWEAEEAEEAVEGRAALAPGRVTPYWQNVQGKVLVAAWHPTRENVLAFGTAEARVGILDLGGSAEKPARVLNVGVAGGVYSLSWGEHNDLYVCAGVDIVVYRFKKDRAHTISVELEGTRWRLTAATWYPTGLVCGSFYGAVALLCNTTYEIQAVNFVFKKLINSIEWHPQYTSSSSEESSLKDLIAVSSMDKCYNIAILKYTQDEDGKHQLLTHKFLEGHKGSVLQLAWSPHEEALLASTSQDCTVRVWDVSAGACVALYGGHAHSAVSVAWSAHPRLARALCSGGADCAVRLWRADDHPPEHYREPVQTSSLTKKEKLKRAQERHEQEKMLEGRVSNHVPIPVKKTTELDKLYGEAKAAEQMASKLKAFKRFLMPISSRQMSSCNAQAARKLARKYTGEEEGNTNGGSDPALDYDTDYLKMFGTTNEFNELLDMEMENHLAAKDTDAWIMLAIFRGQIDAMIQFASKNDLLCPFLVSMSPSVSFKYWKDVMQLYLAQMNRLMAQNQENKLLLSRSYGGPVFRRAALLLAVHDVRGAVDCLLAARLHRDAYALCRARHMESIAKETLWQWQRDSIHHGHLKMSVICSIALGELNKASVTIAGLSNNDESWLSLAADLAKVTGQHIFAGHLEDKKDQIKQEPKNEAMEKILEELPSRIELLLKNISAKNESDDTETKD